MSCDPQSLGQVCRVHRVDLTRPSKITLVDPEYMDLVQKPEDVEAKTLTVRARVHEDMEALKARYLPELGAIQESAANDYRY